MSDGIRKRMAKKFLEEQKLYWEKFEKQQFVEKINKKI